MKKVIFTLTIALMFAVNVYSQMQITNTSYYNTAEQLLLANEINESREPYQLYLLYFLQGIIVSAIPNLNIVLNSSDSR